MEEGRFGGKMELLKLSRFKLQLRALISEARDLRERERLATEQLNRSIQKQKQSEEGFGLKLKESQSELASAIELQKTLERQVIYFQNENALLENKQKELNATIQGLLQSREHFVNAYQDSTCELKRSIETRDRRLKVFSEKLSSHVLLFDSIEKEAISVKQVVDNVRQLIFDKEEIVTGLKRKFDAISEIEKVFIGKISEIEIQHEKYKDEIQRKDKIISELEAKLEAKNIDEKNQEQKEDLERALSIKEAVIQNLITDKQALEAELKSLGAILEKIQHAFRNISEDEKTFQLLESKERYHMVLGEVADRVEDFKDTLGSCSKSQPDLEGLPECTDEKMCKQGICIICVMQIIPLAEMPEKSDKEFQTEEPAYSTTHLACSGPQSTTNAQTMSTEEVKCKCPITANELESESSTTVEETSEHPS